MPSAHQPDHNQPGSPRRRRPNLPRPRILPVERENWTPAQQILLESYDQPERPFNVFTTMANHPELARDWLTFARHMLQQNTLPARERELLILRIGWLCHSEYEWSHHSRIGQNEGLTDDDLRRIRDDPTAPPASRLDRLLLQAVDELHADAMISDETWNGLAQYYDQRQLMDLVFTVGQYNLVSMALNSFGVQLDPGVPGFPE